MNVSISKMLFFKLKKYIPIIRGDVYYLARTARWRHQIFRFQGLTPHRRSYSNGLEQRIYISDRRVSPPPSFSVGSTLPTSLCLLCRQLYRRTGIVRYCRQSGERLGECFLRTTKGGTDPYITNKYALGRSHVGTTCSL